MRGHGADAVLNQWKGSTFWSRKTPCWPLALWQRAAFTTLMPGSCLACILGGAWYNRGTTSGAHLPPSQVDLRPFKATSTTLKPACQERTYDPHSSTYDPSRSHIRPSNPHARSAPTTLTAQPTTLQGHTYDPQTCMSGAHLRPSQLNLRPFKATPTTLQPACQEATTTLCALWPNTKVLAKAREKEERLKAS